MERTINTYHCDSSTRKYLEKYFTSQQIHLTNSETHNISTNVILFISIHSIKENVLEIPMSLRFQDLRNPFIIISFLSFEYIKGCKELYPILNSAGCLFIRLSFSISELESKIQSASTISEDEIQKLNNSYFEEGLHNLMSSLKHGGKFDAFNKFLIPLRLTILNKINSYITFEKFIADVNAIMKSESFNIIKDVVDEIKNSRIYTQIINQKSVYFILSYNLDLLLNNLKGIEDNFDLNKTISYIDNISDSLTKIAEGYGK